MPPLTESVFSTHDPSPGKQRLRITGESPVPR